MYNLALTLLALAAPPSSRPFNDPTDVRSIVRGAQAVFSDPAAPAAAAGFELGGRADLDADANQTNWALGATLPVAGGALGGDYEWLHQVTNSPRRWSLGLSVPLWSRLWLGAAYRQWRAEDEHKGTWDLGLLAEPVRFLSLAVGVDQINEPVFEGTRLRRAWRFGAAARPVRGAAWFTLGADTRLVRRNDDLDLVETRALADVELVSGLHMLAAYQQPKRAWLGFSITLDRAEVVAASSARMDSDPDVFARSAAQLTLRTVPYPGLTTSGRKVELTLTGDLRDGGSGLFGGEVISTVPTRLEALALDPTVSTIILNIGDVEVGLATVEDIRSATKLARLAGKKVVAELHGGGEKEYMIAAAAERIRLDPLADLELDGFSVTLLYFAEALQKIGVRVESVEVGRYKTAPDSLTRASSRPEEREVTKGMLDASFRTLVQVLAQDRKLDADTIVGIVNRGLVTSREALSLGLVDELSQPLDPKELPEARQPGEPDQGPAQASRAWGPKPAIMIVPIVGNIVVGDGATPLPGGRADAITIVGDLDRARSDPSVRGVVLRIDSPGGDIYAAELIWRAVRLLGAQKPVVVSMGDVAASGGYYVAAPADLILAQPSTLTGSIGIFMLKPDLEGLLALSGVNAEILKIGPLADWSSLTRGLSDKARSQLSRGLEAHYRDFLARVAAGRDLEMPYVESIAEGRVYTGEQALELKLVDGIGGLAEALREVVLRAEISPEEDIEVIVPERPFSLASLLRGMMMGAQGSWTTHAATAWRQLRWLERRTLALAPYELGLQE